MPRYRIHYRQGPDRKVAEVEANSPDEAAIKFRHVGPAFAGGRRGELQVTSICLEETADDLEAARLT